LWKLTGVVVADLTGDVEVCNEVPPALVVPWPAPPAPVPVAAHVLPPTGAAVAHAQTADADVITAAMEAAGHAVATQPTTPAEMTAY
jgi:hypothetical protein